MALSTRITPHGTKEAMMGRISNETAILFKILVRVEGNTLSVLILQYKVKLVQLAVANLSIEVY